ncbi:transglutaminase family protein [Variovorax sp. J22R133]|uniref:transglutaminase family protein n=1 Tax=Variovorax brevis TaxID=3053503 RepID=UPI00257685A5|nr:transglutaminase family protein [Variovorax sp. J22R133]MDM0114014.1 transglutaminase family protein [Variovorax sp. J22R133]
MRIHAECKMTVKAAEDCPVVAMMRPRSGEAQWMVSEVYEMRPWVPTTEYVDPYGNLCQRLTIPAGEMRIEVSTVMETEEHIAVAPDAGVTPIARLPSDVLVFLLQSRYCPSDKMEDRAREITQGVDPGYAQVEAIRAWIHENVEYKYGVSDGSTDALDTLDAGSGVCRDFAHIGVALCRALRIPARIVVGYLYELDPMDMHAWFEAYVGGRWYTFDATQAEPRGGRIVVAYGRDAADVAFLSNYGPLEMGDMKVSVHCVGPAR